MEMLWNRVRNHWDSGPEDVKTALVGDLEVKTSEELDALMLHLNM